MTQIQSQLPFGNAFTLSTTASGVNLHWSQFNSFAVDLYRSADNGHTWSALGVDFTQQNTYLDTGLNSFATYMYKFEIQDNTGFIYSSNVLTVTTAGDPVSLPQALTSSQVTDSSVAINWNTFNDYSLSLMKSVNGGAPHPITFNLGVGSFLDTQATAPGTYVYSFALVNQT